MIQVVVGTLVAGLVITLLGRMLGMGAGINQKVVSDQQARIGFVELTEQIRKDARRHQANGLGLEPTAGIFDLQGPPCQDLVIAQTILNAGSPETRLIEYRTECSGADFDPTSGDFSQLPDLSNLCVKMPRIRRNVIRGGQVVSSRTYPATVEASLGLVCFTQVNGGPIQGLVAVGHRSGTAGWRVNSRTLVLGADDLGADIEIIQ